MWRTGAALALAAVFAFGAPSESWAVICSNGGVGANPAGNDGGRSKDTACGEDSIAGGGQNSAYGSASDAHGEASRNVAVGNDSSASGDGSSNTAVGADATASGQAGSNLAVGSGANASADNGFNIAIGESAQARGINSVAVGPRAYANYNWTTQAPDGFDFAIAIGPNAAAFNDSSLAAGVSARATAGAAVALGYASKASGTAAVAVGINSVAEGTASVALGRNAVAEKSSSVAIGNNSIATENYTVSVGQSGAPRRIVNVATAVRPTDAVNLAQANALVAAAASGTLATRPPAVSVVRVGPEDTDQADGDVRRKLAELRALVRQQQQRIADLERRLAASH
jgi:autotransporter adhesin